MKGLFIIVAVFTLSAALPTESRSNLPKLYRFITNAQEKWELNRALERKDYWLCKSGRYYVNPEKEELYIEHVSSNGTELLCAIQTPCSWSVLEPFSDIVEMNITNSYCICGPEKTCQYSERDSTSNALVFRCK